MPFLLDVSSCSIHIQFLLDLCVFAVLSFLVLAISFLPIFLLLLTFGCKISHVMSCLFLHALDLLFILHKLSNLSFLQSVSLVGLLFNNGLLLLDEFSYLFRDNGLIVKCLFHIVNILLHLKLNPEILPLNTKKRSLDLSLLVLPLQL